MGKVDKDEDVYVETDLHTTASKKLEQEVAKELDVEDPSIEDARASMKKRD